MNSRREIFEKLGRRLADFGHTPASRAVIADAANLNNWFSEADICRAVAAIRTQMLDPERIRTWLRDYPDLPATPSRKILVITAGNIPLVGFFDLLCVLISGHTCLLKPAAKDTPLTDYIVGLLRQIEPDIPLTRYDGNQHPDAVIATGSDNANRYFRSRYAGIPTLLRGSRQSVAVLSGKESSAELTGLADDIFAYSGQGCRSISLIFLPRGCNLRISPPPMSPKYHNNYRQTRALLTMEATPFIDLGEAVAVEERAFPLALSQINYTYYDAPTEVAEWLAAHTGELQCIVGRDLQYPCVPFGTAQAPTLTDYPDGADVLKFLTKIK